MGWLLLSPPRGWRISLVGVLVAASYDVPVYDRPDILDMIGTAILVAEVVSMLPDVDQIVDAGRVLQDCSRWLP